VRRCQPPDIADQIVKLYFEPFKGIMPKDAGINMDGMRAVVSLMGEVGELQAPLPKADAFVDLQYLKAAGVPVAN
jgi:hypothetical protein